MEQLALVLDSAPSRDPRSEFASFSKERTIPMQDADRLAERYAQRAHAPNTRRVYQGDWARFEAWCAARGDQAMPAHPRVVAAYLAALAAQGRKPSTIRRARTSIGLAHYYAEHPRPDTHPTVRAVERGIRRTHGIAQRHAVPLLPEDLRRLVKALPAGVQGVRDRALLLVGWAGAMRRSELVRLSVDDVRFRPSGDVVVRLTRSKEDVEGQGVDIVLEPARDEALCPVQALQRWVAVLRTARGPLFVALAGHVPRRRSLHPAGVDRIVRTAAKRAGLAHKGFSAHSLRAGFATAAVRAGIPERDVADRGRWHPDSMGPYVAPNPRPFRLL